MSFTWSQHNHAGHGLQVLYNQCLDVVQALSRAYPQNNFIVCQAEKIPGAALRLKQILENQVMDEFSKDRHRAGKLYARNGQRDFDSPELLTGVPGAIARAFQEYQEKRVLAGSPKKTGLSQVEAQALSMTLKHWQNRLLLLNIELLAAYGPDHESIAAIDKLLRAVKSVSEILEHINPYCLEEVAI